MVSSKIIYFIYSLVVWSFKKKYVHFCCCNGKRTTFRVDLLDKSKKYFTRVCGWRLMNWWIDLLFDWLFVWFIDWYIYKLRIIWTRWMVDWLVGCLIDWLVDLLIYWLIDWLIDWLISNLSINWTRWIVDLLIDWLFDWLVDWLMHLQIENQLDKVNCWLIDFLIY